MVYGVRVRNNPEAGGGAWATYLRAARTAAHMSQSELARQLGVDRTTVWRQENGKQRPESATVVAEVARVLRLDLEEALAAAGLRPDVEPPTEPTVERDEEIEMILNAPVDDRMKKRMLDRLFELREQDKRRRVEDIQWWIKQAKGA